MSPFVLDRTTPRFNRQVALALIWSINKTMAVFLLGFFLQNSGIFQA